jgi:hypothetical protein
MIAGCSEAAPERHSEVAVAWCSVGATSAVEVRVKARERGTTKLRSEMATAGRSESMTNRCSEAAPERLSEVAAARRSPAMVARAEYGVKAGERGPETMADGRWVGVRAQGEGRRKVKWS